MPESTATRSAAPLSERDARAPRGHLLVHLPMCALVALYVVRFAALSVGTFSDYQAPPFDLSIFDQGIWLLSRFDAPFVTVMGRNLFGDHTSFVLLVLVPVYWVWPHVEFLLVLQSLALATSAVPVYLLSRRHLGSASLATALGAAFLLNPALELGNLDQFHPECFLVVGLAWGCYGAIERRLGLLLAGAVLALLAKEDAALYVVPLGLWTAWRRDRRLGLVIAAAAAVYGLVCYEVILPLFDGGPSMYLDRVPYGGVGGLLRATFSHPSAVLDYASSDGRGFYLWQLGAPFGLGFLLAPDLAAICVLAVAENVLSTFPYMHQILYHYSLGIVPVLAVATAMGIARFRGRRTKRLLVALVFGCALATNVCWGLAPFSANHLARYGYPGSADPNEVADITAAIHLLPANADVSAYWPYLPHLDQRRDVYLWPTPFVAEDWGYDPAIEGTRLGFADTVQYLVLPVGLTGSDATTFAAIAPQFRQLARFGDVAVYRRVPRAPAPEDPR